MSNRKKTEKKDTLTKTQQTLSPALLAQARRPNHVPDIIKNKKPVAAFNGSETYSVTASELERLHHSVLNRPLIEKHVKDIKAEMKNTKTLSLFRPVLVNGNTGNIIDGQHTRRAFVDAVKEGIIPSTQHFYMEVVDITPSDELDLMIKLNLKRRNWTDRNYVSAYCNAGMKGYIDLNDFCENHELCRHISPRETILGNKYAHKYRNATLLLFSTYNNGHNSEKIKSGNINPTPAELALASQRHDDVVRILDTLKLPHEGSQVTAVIRAYTKCKLWGCPIGGTTIGFPNFIGELKARVNNSRADYLGDLARKGLNNPSTFIEAFEKIQLDIAKEIAMQPK